MNFRLYTDSNKIISKTIKYIPVGILITFETIRTSNNINIVKFSIENLLILGFLSESDIF